METGPKLREWSVIITLKTSFLLYKKPDFSFMLSHENYILSPVKQDGYICDLELILGTPEPGTDLGELTWTENLTAPLCSHCAEQTVKEASHGWFRQGCS